MVARKRPRCPNPLPTAPPGAGSGGGGEGGGDAAPAVVGAAAHLSGRGATAAPPPLRAAEAGASTSGASGQAKSASARPASGVGGSHEDGTLVLRALLAAGLIKAGRGVLRVTWWGVELPPAADLDEDGSIRLPEGVGEAGATYSPSGLLSLLAKHNRLFGFTKGNGWQAVSYGGRRLAELRAGR